MALRGHESLIQLVGRRRRLVSAPRVLRIEDEPSVEEKKLKRVEEEEEEEEKKRYDSEGSGGKENCREWVQCPVCSKSIRGSVINNHLDACLEGDKKRKCTQLTLSYFASKSLRGSEAATKMAVTALSLEEVADGKGKVVVTANVKHDSSSSSDQTYGSCRLLTSTETEQMAFQSHLETGDSSKSNPNNGCVDEGSRIPAICTALKHITSTNMTPSSMLEDLGGALSSNRNSEHSCRCSCHISVLEQVESNKSVQEHLVTSVDDRFGVLNTQIVGRRFSRGVVLKKDMQVFLRRESANKQDPNAIEVVPLVSPLGAALGHIPKELASHLAPLLDKSSVEIQGFVAAVPEQAFKNVPISLFLKTPMNDANQMSNEELALRWQAIIGLGDGVRLPNSVQIRSSKYQQNFLYLLEKVFQADSHLFAEHEISFLGSFKFLSADAQRLFLRLYQRKGPWFRIENIVYYDVGDATSAIQELLGAKFFTIDDFTDSKQDCESGLRERLEVLNVPDLRQLVCSAQLKTKAEAAMARREQLIDWLITAAQTRQSSISGNEGKIDLTSMISEIAGTCIRISDDASFLLWRLQRLFFVNGGQDLSSFLLVDMGVLKYPSFKCQRTRPVFSSRAALLCYEQALEVGQAMDMAVQANHTGRALHLLDRAVEAIKSGTDVAADVCNSFLAQFSAAWVHTTVITLGVSILERERRYVEAVDLLQLLLARKCCPGRRGYWTVRLSTDLEHLGRKEESLQIAEHGVNDPCIRVGDCLALQRRVIRLGKPPRRWKRPSFADAVERKFREIHIRGRPLNSVTGMKSKFYGYDGQHCGVEELALQFYAGELGGQWEGVHSEGGIWMTFFGILMWDALFADVPDVFQTPFQTGPLDLNTDSFYSTRKSIIQARLETIRDSNVANLVAEAWNLHCGTLCTGVDWERHTLPELQTIAECIGGPGLSSVCKFLAEDHKGFSGGMPDLLLWRRPPCNVKTSSLQQVCHVCRSSAACPGAGQARLVEVKGPRDRLSEQQRAWILLLSNAGLSVEVCKVVENLDTDLKLVSA